MDSTQRKGINFDLDTEALLLCERVYDFRCTRII